MRHLHLTLILTAFYMTGLWAQIPVLTQANSGTIVGNDFSYTMTNYVSPGTSGASQTWDFTNLSTSNTGLVQYLSPSSRPAASSFPGATVVLRDVQSQAEMFYKISSTAQQGLGVVAGGVVITYSDPIDYLHFPFTYNDSYTDNFDGNFVSQGIQFYRSGSVNVSADAYGTLILPYGTINDVIRVKVEETYSDEYTYLGSTDFIYYSTVIYIWFKPGLQTYLFNLSTISSGTTNSEYGSYTDINTVGVENIDVLSGSFNMYPNPANNETNLIFNLKQESEVSIEIFDLVGQRVLQPTQNSFAAGNHTIPLNTAELNTGAYIVALRSGDELIRSKLIVN